jgi:hypothetical protein
MKLYPIYDKDMLAIMHALEKFRQYLVGGYFVVRIGHNNLRYFLEQRDLNERQQKWVSKVQAYDFDIEHVKGKNNIVADALFRRLVAFSMTEISTDWKSILLMEYSKNTFACEFMEGSIKNGGYMVVDDIIYYKDTIYLIPKSTLMDNILRAVHDAPLVGNQGYMKTCRKVRERFSWKGMKGDALPNLRECDLSTEQVRVHTTCRTASAIADSGAEVE